MLELRLLGQFDVRRGGAPIDIPSRPAQSLLAYLALTTGTAHRREKLSGLLWPDANEANARSNLRHALWRIRQALSPEPGSPPDFLQADNISISIQPSQSVWLDTAALDRPLKADTPLPDLIECVGAYGGELLPGFYDDWVVLERERLRATAERKIQILLDRLLEARSWSEAIEWSERWIALGHVPEPAYRALMGAHAGIGDLSAVAAVYQRCRESLRQELGVEPSEQTRALYGQLSAGRVPSASAGATAMSRTVAGSAPPVRTLLQTWRQSQVEVLDLASLALVHAAQDRAPLAFEDARLVIRSALHHDVDLGPWVERAAEPRFAATALEEALREYPKPHIRLKIVRALEGLPGAEAEAALLHAVESDDAAPVKSAAALAAAKRGHTGRVVDHLLRSIRGGSDPAALAALVVLADEVGLPAGTGPLPRVPLGIALGQRRWIAHRGTILHQMRRGALGGAIGLIAVSYLQLIPAAILVPEVIQENLTFVSLPLWLLSLAIVGLLWGGLLGAAVGFMPSLADALWQGRKQGRMRMLFGALAGLVHAVFYIFLTLSGGFQTTVSASVVIPTYLLFGLLVGAALSWVVPRLPREDTAIIHWRGVGAAVLALAVLSIPTNIVVEGDEYQTAIIVDLLTALCVPLALALTFRRKPDPSM